MMPLVKRKGETAKDQPPKYWGPITSVLITLAIYFASQLAVGISVGIYTSLRHWTNAEAKAWLNSSIVAQFFLVFIIEALIIGSVYLLLKKRRFSMKKIGLAWPVWMDLAYALIGVAIYYVIFIITVVALKQFVPSLNLDQKQQLGFDTVTSNFQLILTFISLVLLPPVAEEILVRGFMYTGLRSKLKFVPALLITSAIFATAHLQIGSGAPLLWVAFVDTFILSCVLVYLREKRGTLAAPMIVHMIKNSIAFLALFIFTIR